MHTLIELYDEQAIHNVLATEVFHPDETIILCPESFGREKQERLRTYFQARGCPASLVFIPTDMLSAEHVAERLRSIIASHDDCAVDIAGGTDASLFAAGSVCAELNTPAFTYSRRRNMFYEIQSAPYAQAKPCDVHLRVSDSFLMAGGTMLKGRVDNTALSSMCPMIDPFFATYLEHRHEWTDVITYIQKISQDQELSAEGPMSVNTGRGHMIHVSAPVLKAFESIGLIEKLRITDTTVTFDFHDALCRFCLRDIGSVLEMYVWKACMDTGIFDDVCLSAIVNWDGDMIRPDSVTNEIDVACTRGVVPLFISCKTCVIKTEALNELAILRDRFGAPTARALIITSSASTHGRGAMRRRASELDIAVLEQGDLQKEVLLEHLVSLSEMRDSYHGNRQ